MKPGTIQQRFVVALMDAGRGAETIHRTFAVLRAAFTHAVRDGLMGANIAADIDLPTITRRNVTVWEVKDLQAFYAEAAKHRLGDLFQVVPRTGLRRGEVLGLHWADINFVESTLSIRRTRVEVNGVALERGSAKTDGSAASIELDLATIDALMLWKIRQDTERKAYGECWERVGHVFTLSDGSL